MSVSMCMSWLGIEKNLQVQVRMMAPSSYYVVNSLGQRSDVKSGYGRRRIRQRENLKVLPVGRARHFLTSDCRILSDANLDLSRSWDSSFNRRRSSSSGRGSSSSRASSSRRRRGGILNSNSIATRASYISGEDWPVTEDEFTHVVIGSGIAGMTCAVKVPDDML